MDRGDTQPVNESRHENLVQLPSGGQKRVLLVEDEAIVGMMMRDFLLDCGLFVVGPYGSVAEAMSIAEAGQFDCAILDLNLGNEMIYPVATALGNRKVPFAFVTGYGRESIDERFNHVPVIQKPIAKETLDRYLQHALGVNSIPDRVNPAGTLDPPNAARA